MGCALSTLPFGKKKPTRKTDSFPQIYIPLPRREPVPEFPVLPTFHENPSTANVNMYEEDNWRPYYEGRVAPPIGYSGVGRAPSVKGRKIERGKGKERAEGGPATNENGEEQFRGPESPIAGASGGGGAPIDKKKRKSAHKNMEVIAEDDNE